MDIATERPEVRAVLNLKGFVSTLVQMPGTLIAFGVPIGAIVSVSGLRGVIGESLDPILAIKYSTVR